MAIPFLGGGGGEEREKGVSEEVEILGQASYSITPPPPRVSGSAPARTYYDTLSVEWPLLALRL